MGNRMGPLAGAAHSKKHRLIYVQLVNNRGKPFADPVEKFQQRNPRALHLLQNCNKPTNVSSVLQDLVLNPAMKLHIPFPTCRGCIEVLNVRVAVGDKIVPRNGALELEKLRTELMSSAKL